jgi:hypothetical protein
MVLGGNGDPARFGYRLLPLVRSLVPEPHGCLRCACHALLLRALLPDDTNRRRQPSRARCAGRGLEPAWRRLRSLPVATPV